MKSNKILFLILILALLTISSVLAVPPPKLVTTDKLTYDEYEDVIVSGYNFTPNSTSAFTVYAANGKIIEYLSEMINNTEDGNVSYVWNTQNYCSGMYRIELTDQEDTTITGIDRAIVVNNPPCDSVT